MTRKERRIAYLEAHKGEESNALLSSLGIETHKDTNAEYLMNCIISTTKYSFIVFLGDKERRKKMAVS